jgi:hypothetical protein
MLKFFFQRQKTSADISDTPYNEHTDPYLEHIMDEIRLSKNNIPVTIKEQLKEKEVK